MKEFDRLIDVVNRLRDPKDGCPWDLKQTHESLVPNFIEELYESIEAIENCDYDHLSEELGDLFLHIAMQVRIAEENEEFLWKDVLNQISEKLIRRHPHIFGNVNATDSKTVKMNWEKIKQLEKAKTRKSIIDGIPHSMPALIVAQRMQEKAAAVGFDWPDAAEAVDKVKEEVNEFVEEFDQDNRDAMEDELGDLVFSIVNVARKLGFDTESALRRTIRKFETRFKHIEEYHKINGLDIKESTLEQLDEIWEMAKKKPTEK